MADAAGAGQWLPRQALFEISQLAFGAPACEVTLFEGGDTCGIVAAILEALKSVDKLARDRLTTKNSDYSAQKPLLPGAHISINSFNVCA
jgi:hypothetical protein